MNTYNLKDKIQATSEFVKDIETKSWQEVEYLRAQIANTEVNQENAALVNLFKNLLTSYYIFIGGLENLFDEQAFTDIAIDEEPTPTFKLNTVEATKEETVPKFTDEIIDSDTFEPFEYFVDFDEPFGEPLSDEDLYGKK
jgi:hypothetical protein